MSSITETTGLTATAKPSPSGKAKGFRLTYVSTVSILTVIALLLLWTIAAWFEWIPAMFLPSPLAVVLKGIKVISSGFEGATLQQHLAASLGRVLAALVIAIVTGVPAGFAINLWPTARGIIEPVLEFFRPIPPLAYLPLVIIWFGIGEFAKVLVIYLGILPSIIIATSDGLRSVSHDRINAARSLGASRYQVGRYVLLPHALPSILTGIRIGLGTGWATLVAAELIAATQGIGFMIKGAADFLVTDVVMLGIFVIAFVSISMEFALRALQRLLVPWQGHE